MHCGTLKRQNLKTAVIVKDDGSIQIPTFHNDFINYTAHHFSGNLPAVSVSYIDTDIPKLQDHLGLTVDSLSMNSGEIHEIKMGAYTKMISVSPKLYNFCWDTRHGVEIDRNDWLSQTITQDVEHTQHLLYEKYKEYGTENFLYSGEKPFSINSPEEILKSIIASSIHIAKNSRSKGADFIIIGSSSFSKIKDIDKFSLTDSEKLGKIFKVGELQIYSKIDVYLNIDEHDAFTIGRKTNIMDGIGGVIVYENLREFYHTPFHWNLMANKAITKVGNSSQFNYFTPDIIW